MYRSMKPRSGSLSADSGTIEVELEQEYLCFPADFPWTMDDQTLTIVRGDGSIKAFPIHRIVSVTDDRNVPPDQRTLPCRDLDAEERPAKHKARAKMK